MTIETGVSQEVPEHDTISRILKQGNQRPVELALTLSEQCVIASMARDLLVRWQAADVEQQAMLADELACGIAGAVPRLSRLLVRLRYLETVEAVLVHGLPFDEVLVPSIALALSSMFGVPFNYKEQLDGALAMRIAPKAGSAQNTNSTREEFAAHTDDAALPPELRVTWITLYGVQNPRHTLTGYSSIRTALSGMRPEESTPLWMPNYLIRMPISFNLGDNVWSSPQPILSLDAGSRVSVGLPTYATRLDDPSDAKAAKALQDLIRLVNDNMFFVSLMPGTFFAFNNNRGLHMRTPIGNGERLVFRTYVRTDLHDLRRKSGMQGHVFPLAKLV